MTVLATQYQTVPSIDTRIASNSYYQSKPSPVKPRSKDLSCHFTEATKVRKNNPLADMLKCLVADPALVSLGAGQPHPDVFPFASFTASVVEPGSSAADSTASFQDAIIPARTTSADKSVEPLEHFLQYGNGRGMPSYAKFALEHTGQLHDPQYEDWDVVVSAGNIDAFVKVLMLFCDRGDTLIVDEWTFPVIMATVEPMGINLAPVRMDGEGMVPEDLDAVCSKHPGVVSNTGIRVAYMIPTAQNPTGATMSLQRKKDIYSVAQKHNLVMIEDDPYYYLQFGDYQKNSTYDDLPGLKSLVPSLLSLDTEGRVIRLDSFSKILAPGLRCGWITAPKYITDKIQYHNESSIQQPCGLGQAIVSKLVNQHWGHAGWERHLVQIQKEYAIRRDQFVGLCNQHLKGKVEFTVPSAGMFVWFKIILRPELQNKKGVMQEVFDAMTQNHVLLTPGFIFSPTGFEKALDKPFVRASFSYLSIDSFEIAITRMAEALEPFTC